MAKCTDCGQEFFVDTEVLLTTKNILEKVCCMICCAVRYYNNKRNLDDWNSHYPTFIPSDERSTDHVY